jgi:hypothetical protein
MLQLLAPPTARYYRPTALWVPLVRQRSLESSYLQQIAIPRPLSGLNLFLTAFLRAPFTLFCPKVPGQFWRRHFGLPSHRNTPLNYAEHLFRPQRYQHIARLPLPVHSTIHIAVAQEDIVFSVFSKHRWVSIAIQHDNKIARLRDLGS